MEITHGVDGGTIDDLGVIVEITHGVDGGRRKKPSVGGTNNTRAHYSNP